MHAWHPPRAPWRLARPALLALLLAALGLDRPRPAHAEYLAHDPVTDFQQALKADSDPVRGSTEAALKYRRDNLTDKAARVTSLGDLSRALLLQEWRADSADKTNKVAEVDARVRQDMTDRFVKNAREA